MIINKHNCCLSISTLLTFAFFITFSSIACCQLDTLSSSWSMELSAGMAEHDKRLYSYPNRDRLLRTQTEFFGTYSFGLTIQYETSKRGSFSYSAGINSLYEVATFKRPVVDASIPAGEFAPSIITFVDRHKQLMIAPFGQLNYHFNKSLAFNVRLQPRFRYWVKPVDTSSGSDRKGNFEFSPRSLEAYAGITFSCGRMNLNLFYRAGNVNRYDEYIVNGSTHGANSLEQAPRGYEWFNPVKLTIGVGCAL
ncbi:TonB-dependent receptor [Neolewinella agarilytica]|uniref:Outer membrane protein beta-barrel domain-containing protein n=1 Tax=Neolewinella agarilytica TaxID=478744 RepID=A0A1H9AAC0_9BACT|nr:hypothetical protein [Neolewinella agarilytica]SEP73682.1 hypothetical protein SAMN05444359_10225 [Neolewinella agarilytica]